MDLNIILPGRIISSSLQAMNTTKTPSIQPLLATTLTACHGEQTAIITAGSSIIEASLSEPYT